MKTHTFNDAMILFPRAPTVRLRTNALCTRARTNKRTFSAPRDDVSKQNHAVRTLCRTSLNTGRVGSRRNVANRRQHCSGCASNPSLSCASLPPRNLCLSLFFASASVSLSLSLVSRYGVSLSRFLRRVVIRFSPSRSFGVGISLTRLSFPLYPTSFLSRFTAPLLSFPFSLPLTTDCVCISLMR